MRLRLIDRVGAWWPWRDRAAGLDEEIAFHLAEEAEAQRADGLGDAAARVAARRDFGNVTIVREDAREAWGWGPIDRLTRHCQSRLRNGWRCSRTASATARTGPIRSGSSSAISRQFHLPASR